MGFNPAGWIDPRRDFNESDLRVPICVSNKSIYAEGIIVILKDMCVVGNNNTIMYSLNHKEGRCPF